MTHLTTLSLGISVVAAAVLAVGIVRQLSARRLRIAPLLGLPLLLAFGALQQKGALTGLDLAGWSFLLVGAAGGAALGVARGLTIRTWVDGSGGAWMQGTTLTVLLWGALLGFRIAASVAAHFAGVTATASATDLLLMLAFTFAAQNAVLYARTLRPAR